MERTILDDLVIHADPDQLLVALMKRGATSRRLIGDRVKVSIMLDFKGPKQPRQPRARRTRMVRLDDPRIRIIRRPAKVKP